MNTLASALTGIHGEKVALCDVSVSAALRDLLSEVSVSQTYRNDEEVNIEAVYTFPLPLDAVLLELQVEIGGRVLNGVVVEKKAAEKKYEDAIEKGNAAVMLEAIEPGLYTMNVGNLLPGELAKITFSYALLYRWAGERLRVFLPTTIAPRFGESHHQPHQVPEHSLSVENRFSLRVEVFGSLRDAQFVCPSHAVDLERSPEKVVITLEQAKAAMDRDFILNVKAPQATRSFALSGPDGEGLAAVASFQPFFPGLQQPRPLNLAIVIDCSGSMQGDAIEQARQALDEILDVLQPSDRVTLIAFGNTTSALSDRLLPCNKTNLAKARGFAKQLKANMGGTEIGKALQVAHAALGESESADIFLVTDGEVAAWEAVVKETKRFGHRVFTVGVGSAVSEAFVRGLAAGTGGECELVSPREGMADRVVRHFERMRSPRAKRVVVHWPEGAIDRAPATLGAVFEGDTVFACARFKHPSIGGNVVLEVETEKGEVFRQELAIGAAPLPESADRVSTVARLAASSRLKELDESAGRETALRYRLVSPWTNWLVVAERAEGEQMQDLPALRKVPQTLAAGWAGAGQLAMAHAAPVACMVDDALSSVMRKSHISSVRAAQNVGPDKYDIPAFLRKQVDEDLDEIPAGSRPQVPPPFRRLLELIEDEPSRLAPERALDLLREAGLASEYEDLFRHAADLGLNVKVIAAMALAGLLMGALDRHLSDATRGAVASLRTYTQRATETLKEIGRRAAAFRDVIEDDIAREILNSKGPGEFRETIERLTEIRALLKHLDDCVRKSSGLAEPQPLRA